MLSLTPDHIIYRYEFHPHPPVHVVEFLRNELKVSKKYVVMLSGTGAEHLSRMWMKHVHLLCLVEANKEQAHFQQSLLGEEELVWMAQAPLTKIPVDDDSIDCFVLLGNREIEKEAAFKTELRRMLRLNSYVLKIEHELSAQTERTFSWAFSHFFKQYSETGVHEYDQLSNEEELKEFFTDGYEHRAFANQVRVSWEALQAYYQASKGALAPDHPKYKWALKALRILFDQYQVDGKVVLDYQTHVFYGLYNKYVPAISLRKNIFFNLLRPFAFGFYILVKMNMYLWRSFFRAKPDRKTHPESVRDASRTLSGETPEETQDP